MVFVLGVWYDLIWFGVGWVWDVKISGYVRLGE